MLAFLRDAKLSKFSALSIIVLILAAIFGTSHILPGLLPYFVFIVLAFSSAPVANSALGTGSQSTKLIRVFWISVSLIGEEIITASLTFPLYTLIHKKLDNKKSWIIAAIVGSLLFGLLHFRAYNWNLYQMFFPIGLGRLPFTWLWIKSDSLWPSIVAHVLYDLILFLPMIFL